MRRHFHVFPVPAIPGSGRARVAAYRRLPEVLADFSVDIRDVLDAVGLPHDSLDDPDTQVAYPQLGRLLEVSARQARCDHLGLLLAQHVRLADMGVAGEAAMCGQTVGDGLRIFAELFELHNSAAIAGIITSDSLSKLVYAIAEPAMVDTRQLQLGSAAVACNILRDLCGPDWRPVEIHVASSAPSSMRPCQRYFRAPVRFDAGETAVVFDSHWLQRPLPRIDKAAREQIETVARSQQRGMLADFPSTTRRVMRRQLLLGNCSIDSVAEHFNLHRRTLGRRLQRHGASYSGLLDAVRYEVACELLRDTRLRVQQIAETLGYSSPANFSTAFRRWARVSPRDFRRARLVVRQNEAL